MFGHVFYHDTIKKYVIYFGTLFNDLYINKTDGTKKTQTIKVPISYGPKEKFLTRLTQDPKFQKPVAIQLPRMGFELIDLNYAPERKLPTINRMAVQNPSNSNLLSYQYSPVPYDFNFSLYIFVKQADDGTRILEQILPFFTPDWTATLNLDSTMMHKYDVPVVLNSVSSQDTYEGDFITRRAIIWSLQFTMKGYIFGPTTKSKAIKTSYINLYEVGNKSINQFIAANGNPTDVMTTIPIVAGKTVDQIEADDDYTIETTIENYYDQ